MKKIKVIMRSIAVIAILFLGFMIFKINFEEANVRVLRRSEKVMERDYVRKFDILYNFKPQNEWIKNKHNINEISKSELRDMDYVRSIFPEVREDFYNIDVNESGYYRSSPFIEFMDMKDVQLSSEYFFSYNKKVFTDFYTRQKFNVIDIMVFKVTFDVINQSKEEFFLEDITINSKINILANYRGVISERKNKIDLYEIEDNKKLSIFNVNSEIVIGEKDFDLATDVRIELVKNKMKTIALGAPVLNDNIDRNNDYTFERYRTYVNLNSVEDMLTHYSYISYNSEKVEKNILIKYFFRIGYIKN